jgi:RNA polymerase sigma-70 factor, ECF subfamily
MDDAVLVERTLSGDLSGFGELHRRYYQRVVRVVASFLRDHSQAEDLVQDAYLSALRDLAQLREPSRFYPWICRIAVNRAIDARRRSCRREKLDPRIEPSPSPFAAAEDGLLGRERAGALRVALEKLPERQRAAVVLRFFDELPMSSVAQVLGCEEATARSQVFRGLRKLGVFLKTRKGGSP